MVITGEVVTDSIRPGMCLKIPFNKDGTVSFTVKKGSEIAGWEMQTAGRVVFDPRENSVKLSTDNPTDNSVFVVRNFNKITPPLKFIRDNVNIQLDKGMFLTYLVTVKPKEKCSSCFLDW